MRPSYVPAPVDSSTLQYFFNEPPYNQDALAAKMPESVFTLQSYASCRYPVVSIFALADRPFHLQLNESIHLNGELHRELLDNRLDKAAHDHA